MGCVQCSSGACGSVEGVKSGSKSGGCNKLNTFDWLADMDFDQQQFHIVEVKFKGGRKEFYNNKHDLDLTIGDFVVCEMATGYHIGAVSLKGDLVRLQLKKKSVKETNDLKIIHRIATEKDLEKHHQAIERDLPTMFRTREICRELNLNLKLSDVEFQSDNSKATFYYTADDRVDFRELIKILASEFKVRIEMKQISVRQEAGRLGGIGSCGRELCCSTWMTDFKAIPTAAARYQNLSLNPAKLSGQCGRLKCCLNFELETYIDALKGIPTIDKPLLTEKGKATLQKTDIFRKIMWFSYPDETNWYPISTVQVVEIQKMNAEGKKPLGLENLAELSEDIELKAPRINSDLDRLDKKYKKKKPNHSKSLSKSEKPQETPLKTAPIEKPSAEASTQPKKRKKFRNRKPGNQE